MVGSEDTPETRLVLIRHGESNASVERRIAGYRTCSGLSLLGVRQTERLCERLLATDELRADELISSNFPRAIETADILAPALGLDVSVDARFGEHDPGPALDGMSFTDYVDRFGVPDWHGDPHDGIFPGGETTAEFHLRVGAAVSELVTRATGRTIVVACHGGVVDAVFRLLLRLPSTGVFELHTTNTSLTEFARVAADRWRIVRYNDAAHLAGLPTATGREGD